MNWYLRVLQNYAVFNGRARRKEYWMFVLFNMIISFLFGFLDGFLGLGYLSSIYSLIVFIPSIAVMIRRVHEVGKSGWFCLIPIYNLILALTPGDEGENKYGSDPKLIVD